MGTQKQMLIDKLNKCYELEKLIIHKYLDENNIIWTNGMVTLRQSLNDDEYDNFSYDLLQLLKKYDFSD